MGINNLKVGVRLGIGFAAVLLLLVGITAVGVTRLSTVNAGTHLIIEDRYPNIAMAYSIQGNLNQVARSMRNAIIFSDSDTVKKELATIEAARARNVEKMAELEKRISTPKGKELFKALVDARASYVPLQTEVVNLISAGKKEEARDMLIAKVRPAQLAYFKALDELINFQSDLMKQTGEEANEAYEGAKKLMFSLAALAMLLAAAIGWWVTRSITKPLNEAVNVAQKVAEGDLTVEVEVKSKDETGQLLAALKAMNESLRRIVGEVRTGTEAIGSASKQIASGNADLSQRTEEQASSLEETASSMEELTSTVKQNADNAKQANQLAASASAVAVKGGEVVGHVVGTMTAINDSSKKIVQIGRAHV